MKMYKISSLAIALAILCITVFVNTNLIANSKDIVTQINPTGKLEIKRVMFSATKYSTERNLFIKENKIHKSKLKMGKIYVALEDLNSDGINEMIVYVDNYYYCGNETGCPLYIFQIQSQNLRPLLEPKDGLPIFMDINKNGEQKEISVLSSKTNNWHDLLIRNEFVWKWNGNYYKYSEKITRG